MTASISRQSHGLARMVSRWRSPRLSTPAGIAAVLTAAIALRVLTLVASEPSPSAASSVVTSQPRAAGPDVGMIVSANLFGRPAAAGEAAVSNTSLVLLGVIARSDPAAGMAVIGPTMESTALYRGGEELQSGLRLKAVYRDYVLLERAGQLERVEMKQSFGSTGLLSASVAVAAVMVDRSPVPRPHRQVPVMVGEVIRTQLVRANGQLQGYRIFPGAEQQAFERLGLRAGDVVLSVNGRKAGDATGGDLMQVLKSDRRAQVTIARGGVQQEVMLNIDDFSS